MSDEPRRSQPVDPARLRAAEWLAGLAGLVLLVDLFAVHWYGGNGAGATGWETLSVLRWVLALSGLVALALAAAQAARRAPALPVTLSVCLTVLASVAVVWLLIRVADPPGALHVRAGAAIGLAAGVVLLLAGAGSMRREGILDRDGPGEIPTVSI